jgi:antitoxin MazE
MRVQISKWGNSTALRLPKAVIEELRLKPGQEIELSVQNGEARIRPMASRGRVTLADLVAEMRRLGPQNEPPLVDWGPDVGAEIIDDKRSEKLGRQG